MSTCGIALMWLPQNTFGDESTLFQVMAYWCQATSHYPSQCWPKSKTPYGICRLQWVDINIILWIFNISWDLYSWVCYGYYWYRWICYLEYYIFSLMRTTLDVLKILESVYLSQTKCTIHQIAQNYLCKSEVLLLVFSVYMFYSR